MRCSLIAVLPLIACSSPEPVPVPARDAGPQVRDGGVGNCGDSWLLTYQIDGTFFITDTTGGMGNADRPLTTGSLTLRVPDQDGAPGSGAAQVVDFEHGEQFTVTAFGIETITDVAVKAGPNPCGVAAGTRSDDTLTWAECTANDQRGVDKNSWTPDDPASGSGCLNDYSTRGNVACEGLFCSTGGLEEGDNPQAEDYHQPLEAFVFEDGWDRFTMARSEIPNRTPSRTWFTLRGELLEQELSNTPMCLCAAP